MNSVWILLWVSTAPIFGGNIQIGIERKDNYSIRESSTAIVEWMNALNSHGKGFQFEIFKAKPFTVQQMKNALKKKQ